MAKKMSERNPITRWEIRAKNPKLFQKNNKVVICGQIEEDFKYSHRIPGTREKIYRNRVITIRDDGKTKDYIPILVSEYKLKNLHVKNMWIELAGKITTYRGDAEDGHRYKGVNVFISECYIRNNKKDLINSINENIVFIEGFLVQDALAFVKFKTELNIAVKRSNSVKSDYVPSIALGERAQKIRNFKLGDHVSFYGRFQSRKYPKKNEEKTVYEIFTYTVRLLDE